MKLIPVLEVKNPQSTDEGIGSIIMDKISKVFSKFSLPKISQESADKLRAKMIEIFGTDKVAVSMANAKKLASSAGLSGDSTNEASEKPNESVIVSGLAKLSQLLGINAKAFFLPSGIISALLGVNSLMALGAGALVALIALFIVNGILKQFGYGNGGNDDIADKPSYDSTKDKREKQPVTAQ
jgi:hypothetical protein